MLDARYTRLLRELSSVIPKDQLIDDPLRTLAYGADASFYHLVPKLVVRVEDENDVSFALCCCNSLNIPYTFRAAGTSLSGQAVSDSVLIQVSRLWDRIEIAENGLTARLQPAVLGGAANAALAKFRRKIGPDPASIDSAMIGGIAANNASGMCCGNIQDTYHTVASMRVVMGDGAILDTASHQSRVRFAMEHPKLLRDLETLAHRTKSDQELAARIARKYKIKNTVGYSLNSLIDFTDPFDILCHLIVGSEGTLGFISEIVYNTVPDPPHHATALLLFGDIRAACNACIRLRHTPVSAVELMDRPSLKAVENKPGIPEYYRSLGPDVTALLVETAADTSQLLAEKVAEITDALRDTPPIQAVSFTHDPKESKKLWTVRKGLFPSLGYSREKGSTIIIEDIAVPPELLADAAIDLRRILFEHNYREAVIFGHALQGNLHFVFCQDFSSDEECSRYDGFMQEVTRIVTGKYDGSLKAEHGTGRNMAPFVEREWGVAAMGLMREIKRIFDPKNLSNPGVILNSDPMAHIKDVKKTWATDTIIEKCTECGFCERTCPSRHLTLTPRQRIVAAREISRLTDTGEDQAKLTLLRESFSYQGEGTCAVDGLCGTLCPLDIDTGKFIKQVRQRNHSAQANRVASLIAAHLETVGTTARLLLRVAGWTHKLLGTSTMTLITGTLRSITGGRLPHWNPWLPRPAAQSVRAESVSANEAGLLEKVVYFPSCVSRLFGVSAPGAYQDSQNIEIQKLLRRGGYDVVYPSELGNACCGMAFSSKGFAAQGDRKLEELRRLLLEASQGGKLPIVFDTSPCAHRLREAADGLVDKLQIYDLTEFILERLAPRLQLQRLPKSVAVHVPCSLVKMGMQQKLVQLAELCAESVHVPASTPCCGFAGDRGFTYPELPASALVQLKAQVKTVCEAGYSTSRTCEIGLSAQSGISYQSIAYLVCEASERGERAATAGS